MVIEQWSAARQEKGLGSITALDIPPQMCENDCKNWLYCVVTGVTDQSTPGVVLVPCPLIWKRPARSRTCLHFPGLHWHELPRLPGAQHLLQQQLCAVLLPRRVSASSAAWIVPAGLKGNTMCPILCNLFLIMQNFRRMSNAIIDLDRFSRCLRDCKIPETVGLPVWLLLLFLSVVYSSPCQDRFAAIKVLQLTYF